MINLVYLKRLDVSAAIKTWQDACSNRASPRELRRQSTQVRRLRTVSRSTAIF